MTKKRKAKGPVTAEELMAKLQSNPEWVEKMESREQWRRARKRRFRELEQPLVADLATVGYRVDSVWDLVNTREPYPEAIPVLLRHLKRTEYHPDIRQGIARALTCRDPQVKGAIPELLEAFRRDPDPSLNGPKWAIGNAIEVIYDDRYFEKIVELVRDRSHGPARTMLVRALRKSKTQLAGETLKALRDDPDQDVALVADQALARLEKAQKRRSQAARK
jgi:HEAT repeat protein